MLSVKYLLITSVLISSVLLSCSAVRAMDLQVQELDNPPVHTRKLKEGEYAKIVGGQLEAAFMRETLKIFSEQEKGIVVLPDNSIAMCERRILTSMNTDLINRGAKNDDILDGKKESPLSVLFEDNFNHYTFTMLHVYKFEYDKK